MERSFKKLPKQVKYYVVIYDILSGSDVSPRWSSGADWRRTRIARILLEVGIRTQRSVFEINVPRAQMEKTLLKIEQVAKEELDKIYFYPIEEKVKKKIKRLGYKTPLLGNIFI